MEIKILHIGIIVIIIGLILLFLPSCMSWTPDHYIDPIEINNKIKVVDQAQEENPVLLAVCNIETCSF